MSTPSKNDSAPKAKGKPWTPEVRARRAAAREQANREVVLARLRSGEQLPALHLPTQTLQYHGHLGMALYLLKTDDAALPLNGDHLPPLP